MRKRYVIVPLIAVMFASFAAICFSEGKNDSDSRELQLQDMLMLVLLPEMNAKLAKTYSNLLKEPPMLYPYFIEVENTERIGGFRSFSFLITLKVTPTVGPHISVGQDRFVFKISPYSVHMVGYQHLKDPVKSEFPPNYADIVKQPPGIPK